MNLSLYQTLEDLDNADFVEKNGPFKCETSKAWLGHGYYFWDTHIELGHWWGKMAYPGNEYMICKGHAKLDSTCWDLHGNGEHRLQFMEICNELVRSGLTTKSKLLASQVISMFIRKNKFTYKAIRALGVYSIKDNTFLPKELNLTLIERVRFINKNIAYLDLHPPIQVCLIEKRALSLTDYKVVYPQHYCDYYV